MPDGPIRTDQQVVGAGLPGGGGQGDEAGTSSNQARR